MTTIGVLGGAWRATVSPAGAVQLWDGSAVLDWHVAADDRWHSPAHEPTVRQVRIDGTPVIETRVRIPNGDAVQRVYAAADAGGLVVVEVENDSPLPIAVAFTRGDLLSARPPTAQPIRGIELPPGSVVFPVGHHTTVRVALAPGGAATALPQILADADQVARGWASMSQRASRISCPDEAWERALHTERCVVALDGPADDPIERLIGVGELVRMGEPPGRWVEVAADAVEDAARSARPGDWALPVALDAARRVFSAAGERRAVRDVERVRRSIVAGAAPARLPQGIVAVPWIEQSFGVVADGSAALLPHGLPPAWLGTSFECHGIPLGSGSSVSYAVRWHGERPAVLWEVQGDPIALTAPSVAPGWRSSERSGESLWPAPVTDAGTMPVTLPASDVPVSFS